MALDRGLPWSILSPALCRLDLVPRHPPALRGRSAAHHPFWPQACVTPPSLAMLWLCGRETDHPHHSSFLHPPRIFTWACLPPFPVTGKQIPSQGEQMPLGLSRATDPHPSLPQGTTQSPRPRSNIWKHPALGLEKEMAIHSGILAWRILWTEEAGRLQSVESLELDTTEQLNKQPLDGSFWPSLRFKFLLEYIFCFRWRDTN